MLNICFLDGDMSRVGGTERVLSIIANELAEKVDKFNIHILNITNYSGKSSFKLDEKIRFERILNIKMTDINFKSKYLEIVKGIRGYIKENKGTFYIDDLGISLIETLDKLNIDLYKEKTVELQKMLKKVYKNEISKEKALEIFSVNL